VNPPPLFLQARLPLMLRKLILSIPSPLQMNLLMPQDLPLLLVGFNLHLDPYLRLGDLHLDLELQLGHLEPIELLGFLQVEPCQLYLEMALSLLYPAMPLSLPLILLLELENEL
jgi:hypothetical protein